MQTKPLIDKSYRLEKFPGKGGWTYAAIPGILQDKNAPFGWVKVRGSIDDHEFNNYHLMPMGNGKLFLPVRAEIRKKLNKKEGDLVKVTLWKDDAPLKIPEELVVCFEDEPRALTQFLNLKAGEQKQYIDWIYSAKREETKVARIAAAIQKILKGHKHPGTGQEYNNTV